MDKVEICNMAISHLRASSIAALTDNSIEAKYCTLFYDTARRAALEAFDWNFARRKLTLQLIKEYDDTQQYGFLFRYNYPVDCLRARYIPRAGTSGANKFNDNGRYPANYTGLNGVAIPAKFELALGEAGDTRTVLTDEESACLVYTTDLENTNLFSFEFVLSLSYLLASLLAVPIGKGERDSERCMKIYDSMIPNIAARNANEEDNPQPKEISEYEAARL